MLFWVLLAIALVSTLYAMLAAAWVPVGDPDVWWVAAAGREMLETHAVPRANLFSFTDPGHAWIMHEWLLGPLYALGLEQLGPAFFVLIGMGVLGFGLVLLVQATLGRAQQPFAGALLLAVSAVFFLRRLQTARPTSLSLIFPLLMVTLAFGPRFTRARWIGCTLLAWLWANCHGSFPIGIALLLLAALERPDDRGLRLSAAVAAGAVSTINPYGFGLHRFVWNYFSGDAGIYREIHGRIVEFGSLVSRWGSLIGLSEVLGFGLVMAFSLAALWRREHRYRALLCLGLLLMAARQARHLELAGLVSCMLLVPWADDWVTRRLPLHRASFEVPLAFRRRGAQLLILPTFVLGLGVFGYSLLVREPSEWINSEYTYLDALPALPPARRVYVPFRAGGLAIWRGFPRGIRVFYDSRNDCYSVETLRLFSALGFPDTEPQTARKLLDQTGTDAVVIPEDHPLNRVLRAAPDWERLPSPTGHAFRRRSEASAQAQLPTGAPRLPL